MDHTCTPRRVLDDTDIGHYLRAATDIHNIYTSTPPPPGITALRDAAYQTAYYYRDGHPDLTLAAITFTMGRSGNVGCLLLALAYSDLIGPTREWQRAALTELAQQFAFPTGHSPGRYSRQIKAAAVADLRHGLDHAAQWLGHHANDPVDALIYGAALIEHHPAYCLKLLLVALCCEASRHVSWYDLNPHPSTRL